VWAIIGGGILAGAAWYLKHVSPRVPSLERANGEERNEIQDIIEVLPWIGLLIGTYVAYAGVVRLIFGGAAGAVDAEKTKVAGTLYWVGFLLALGAVALVAFFVLHLRLWAVNADYYK